MCIPCNVTTCCLEGDPMPLKVAIEVTGSGTRATGDQAALAFSSILKIPLAAISNIQVTGSRNSTTRINFIVTRSSRDASGSLRNPSAFSEAWQTDALRDLRETNSTFKFNGLNVNDLVVHPANTAFPRLCSGARDPSTVICSSTTQYGCNLRETCQVGHTPCCCDTDGSCDDGSDSICCVPYGKCPATTEVRTPVCIANGVEACKGSTCQRPEDEACHCCEGFDCTSTNERICCVATKVDECVERCPTCETSNSKGAVCSSATSGQQICVDPNDRVLSNWICKCVPPYTGNSTIGKAATCTLLPQKQEDTDIVVTTTEEDTDKLRGIIAAELKAPLKDVIVYFESGKLRVKLATSAMRSAFLQKTNCCDQSCIDTRQFCKDLGYNSLATESMECVALTNSVSCSKKTGCSFSTSGCAAAAQAPGPTTITPSPNDDDSFPLWAIFVIVAAVLLCAMLVFCLSRKNKKPIPEDNFVRHERNEFEKKSIASSSESALLQDANFDQPPVTNYQQVYESPHNEIQLDEVPPMTQTPPPIANRSSLSRPPGPPLGRGNPLYSNHDLDMTSSSPSRTSWVYKPGQSTSSIRHLPV